MKRYNHRKAARLAAKVKKLKASANGDVRRSPVTTKSVTTRTKQSAVKKPIKKVNKAYRTRTGAPGIGLSRSAVIAIIAVIFIAVVAAIGFFVFDINLKPGQSASASKKNSQQTETTPGEVYSMATLFTREQVTSNLMQNSNGNFVTVENDSDYYFKDLVFRETDTDGNIIQKKVISSEYTLFTYFARHCDDIIELADGYLLVGYAQRGDYAMGKSDRNIWYAKIDFNANIVWERVRDDGYLQSQILEVESLENDEYRLYIRSEALKRWFLIIDDEGEPIRSYDLNEDFVAYADTDDDGKVFIKKQTRDISIIKKVDQGDKVVFEAYIIGDYFDIFPVAGGYLLFGEKEIDKTLTSVATFVNDAAEVVWDKTLSTYGSPTIKDIAYSEGKGYLIAGYIFATGGTSEPRTVTSPFDGTEQQIEDAWIVKMDEAFNISWERTYAYGDMGALFDGVIQLTDDEYFITGIAQYQGDDAATIIQDRIVTKILDADTSEDSEYVDIESAELEQAPIIDYVGGSAVNYNIIDGGMANDYALKVYWQSVKGAVEYKIDIMDDGIDLFSATTKNENSFVIEDVKKKYGLGEQLNYTCYVTAIDEQNSSIKSEPFKFSFYNHEYYSVRSWFPGFDQENMQADFYYRLGNGASTVEIFRNKVNPDGSVESRSISTRHNDTIDEDFTTIGYGTYFYRMVLNRDDGSVLIKDTPEFTFSDPDPADLSYIELDEARLKEEVELTDDDIANLRMLIHLGQFNYKNRNQVRLLQLFCNYYLDDLAKLGIYSPETEPESGFDIPIDVNHYFQEDTRKAMVYLMAYFGRFNIDGENAANCVDEDFFYDIAQLNKLPVSNDIIAAFRSDGTDSKYNAGYSFDTNYNFIEGVQFAIPVDHDPQKSAYFGIRYLPVLNGEEYDTGVRLHAGLDFRSEDLIVDDVEYIQSHAGEEYIDTADKVEEEEAVEQTRREIIRDRIYSPYDGVIVKTIESDVGNGNHVMIKHVTKDAEKTVFYSQHLHLSSILCSVGQQVKRGEIIGTMGNTGYSGGKHLHLEFFTEEMRVQTFLNPLIYDYAYPPLKEEALVLEHELGLDQ